MIIEDDPVLNHNIKEALVAENYAVQNVFDSSSAELLLQNEAFDCVIMDVNLPDKSGFELCKNFRNYNATTPVIMLTAFSEIEDKVKGFECGANDYLTKPFYMRELLIRINALIKRNSATNDAKAIDKTLQIDDIIIHLPTKKVSRQEVEVLLTPREFQLLLKLISSKGEIVSKNELIKEIWGNIVDANTNTIEVYINFLRNKIDKPFGKNSIKTKIGYGYYFEE